MECFHPQKRPSKEAYHLNANTQTALVINLSYYCLPSTTNGFTLPPPFNSNWGFFSTAIARSHSYASAPWQFYLPSVLLTQWIAGRACVMQITLGYWGDRRQHAFQDQVKPQSRSFLFYSNHRLFCIPFPSTAFSQLKFQFKPCCIQGQALCSFSQLWQNLN